MAGLVLDLGEELRLALEGRGARHPIALGLHADDFGMGVLGNLPDQRAAVLLRHPVVRLDLLLGVDARLKRGEFFRVLGLDRSEILGVQRLGVHPSPRSKSSVIRGFDHRIMRQRASKAIKLCNAVSQAVAGRVSSATA